MIPNHVLEGILESKERNAEVVRLAYDLAYEGRLKRPEESSIEFMTKRLYNLLDVFEKNK